MSRSKMIASAILAGVLGPGSMPLGSDSAEASVGQVLMSKRNGFPGVHVDFPDNWRFGRDVEQTQDVDGDGIPDILIGAPTAIGQGLRRSWTPIDNSTSVLSCCVRLNGCIVDSVQNFAHAIVDTIFDGEGFGASVSILGDLDGNSAEDYAVGAPGDDEVAMDAGAVYLILRTPSGGVLGTIKIPSLESDAGDSFGASLDYLGDIDGPGPGLTRALLVGAPGDDTGGTDRGAAYIILLDANGSVVTSRKLSSASPQLSLDDGDAFGGSIASIGDFGGGGARDILVGAPLDDDGGLNRGAVWLIELNANLTPPVQSASVISSTTGGGPLLSNGDRFGSSCTAVGDVDGDSVTDFVVGALGDDTSGSDRGAVHLLIMQATGDVGTPHRIDDSTLNGPVLADGDEFGRSVAFLGDLGGGGAPTIAVGAPRDDGGGVDQGAVWVLFLDAPTVSAPDAFTPKLGIAVLPNPVRGPAVLQYWSDATSQAELSVYDLQGRQRAMLARGPIETTARQVVWTVTDPSGSRLPPGVYFVRLATGAREFTRSFVVLD